MPKSVPDFVIEKWRGIYARGSQDTTPPDFFIDSLNCQFNENDVKSRNGSIKSLSQLNIVRFFMYKRLNETPRSIYLLNNGQIYDSLYPVSPIWTDAQILDFSMVTYSNRAYITVHNRVTGIGGKFIIVYDGSGPGGARLAGAAAPSASLGATDSGLSGNIQSGVHLIAIAFETASGFISPPSTAIAYTAAGGKKCTVTNIPTTATWPAGTVAIRFLATMLINPSLYNGNTLAYTYFFVPSSGNGRIVSSTGTVDINFFDTDLSASADYLFDEYANIPAGVFITTFGNRIAVGGIPGFEHTVFFSKANEPESFDQVAGFVTADPSEAESAVRNFVEYRSSGYICKSDATYVISDNGFDPSTWKPVIVEHGAGTECFGVSTILDHRGQSADRFFMAARGGLLTYEGYFKNPEVSWLVFDIWQRINFAVFNQVQVCTDPISKSIYVLVPLDGAVIPSHILYGFYGTAINIYGMLEPEQIKWSLWQMPAGLKSIVVDVDTVTNRPILKFASTQGIYDVKDGLHTDDGSVFISYVQTALYTKQAKWINQCPRIGVRAIGSGSLKCYAQGLDNSNQIQIGTITLATGREFEVKCNYQNERISFKFQVDNAGDYFQLIRAEMYGNLLWATRPS